MLGRNRESGKPRCSGLQTEVRDVEEGVANSEHEVLAHADLELGRPGVGQRVEPELDDQPAQGPIGIAIEPDTELATGAAQVRDHAIGVDASATLGDAVVNLTEQSVSTAPR